VNKIEKKKFRSLKIETVGHALNRDPARMIQTTVLWLRIVLDTCFSVLFCPSFLMALLQMCDPAQIYFQFWSTEILPQASQVEISVGSSR